MESAVQGGHDNTMIIGGQVTLNVEHFALTMVPPPTPLLTEIPPDAAFFTGRRQELAILRRLLKRHGDRPGSRVAIGAIAGKPGIGKSALAVHAAHELASEFPDGQLYINLRGADDEPLSAEAALDELLRRFEVTGETMPQTLDGKAALYRRQVAGRKVLVVLDNAASEQQVRPLLPGTSTCAAIVTSRQVLAALDATLLELEVLNQATAVTLLRRVAGSARLRGQADAVATVAKLCGYLPLALRIVGAKLAVQRRWTVAYLAERLADERRRLAELGEGDLDVRACFALSYRDLSPADARAFRMLGLVPGPDFAGEIAGAILAMEPEAACEHMERLVRLQLLELASGDSRYRFHDLLRLYARECLEADELPDNQEDATERMFYCYQDMAEILQGAVIYPRMHEQVFGVYAVLLGDSAIESFEAERENLIAAMDAAFRAGDAYSGSRIGQRLMDYLFWRGYWDECEHAASAVANAEHFSIGSREIYATQEAIAVLARLSSRRGNWKSAISYLAYLRDIDYDSVITGEMEYELGNANAALKHWTAAEDHYLRSREFYEQQENHGAAAMTMIGLCRVYRAKGDWAGARAEAEKARSWFLQDDDLEGTALAAAEFGNLSSDLQEWEDALGWYEQSLAKWKELESQKLVNKSGAAAVLNGIGIVYGHQGRLDEAAMLHEQAAEIFQLLGIRDGEAQALAGLGEVRIAQARKDEAVHVLEKAIAIFDELRSAEPELWEKAANAGSASAAFRYALHISAARPAEAERWYRKAADAGSVDAAVNLGVMIQHRDPSEAELLYRMAADAGDYDGQYNLSVLLLDSGREEEGASWLRKAATAGQHYAQHRLGSMLAGQGRRKEAEDWWKKAEAGLRRTAKKGIIHAVADLGILSWERGELAEAEAFLRDAAQAGHVNSMVNLGLLYKYQGRLKKAGACFRKAAKAGYVPATQFLEEIIKEQAGESG